MRVANTCWRKDALARPGRCVHEASNTTPRPVLYNPVIIMQCPLPVVTTLRLAAGYADAVVIKNTSVGVLYEAGKSKAVHASKDTCAPGSATRSLCSSMPRCRDPLPPKNLLHFCRRQKLCRPHSVLGCPVQLDARLG